MRKSERGENEVVNLTTPLQSDLRGDRHESGAFRMAPTTVHVKATSDENHGHVELSLTVAELKATLAAEDKANVPANQQRLIYRGHAAMKDERALESYGLAAEHTVHLVKGLAPGGAAAAATAPAAAAASAAVPTPPRERRPAVDERRCLGDRGRLWRLRRRLRRRGKLRRHGRLRRLRRHGWRLLADAAADGAEPGDDA